MAKMVGLNVSLKMGWIKKAVELLSHNLPEEEYKNELRTHLSFEIDSLKSCFNDYVVEYICNNLLERNK